MFVYLVRRILLTIPTFIGITLLTFVIINSAPGGPIEQKIQAIRFGSNMGGGEGGGGGGRVHETGVSQEVIDALKKQYGFDKPLHIRYLIWLKNIAHLDFGDSFTYQEPAMDVIVSKFPVSLQFGVMSLLLTYLICIPQGMRMATKAGGLYDRIMGMWLNFTYAVPPLVLAIFLIDIFAVKLDLFPIGGFKSDNYDSLTTAGQIWDRVHHFILPLACYMIGGFTELSYLMRNSMLEVIYSDYVRTARAKGVSERTILFKHALRNALVPIVPGLAGYIAVFLGGSLILERIFNLDGIGLLGYQSLVDRDYNVIMGLTFLSAMALVVSRILSDIIYVLIDPRIDFK